MSVSVLVGTQGSDRFRRDESLEDADALAEPEVIAAEIVKNLRAALEELELVAAGLA